MSQKRRVVVTGLGCLTPLGLNVSDSWKKLIQGESGVGHITHFDASTYPCRIAAEVKGFQVENFIPRNEARKLERFTQFSVVAGKEALTDSGLNLSLEDLHRIGVVIGVGMGGIKIVEEATLTLKEKGIRRLAPLSIPMMIPNLAAGQVSIKFGLKGPNSCTTTACAAGAHAVGDSFLHIREGRADVMLCVGAESVITPVGVGAFCACRALSTEKNDTPQKASRPFDKDRDGFVMGEGAGILVLEEYERACRRGAKIYAEIVGYGLNCDAYHITSPTPDGDGAARCMQLALKDAHVSPEEVGYINAHGTSTPVGDIAETLAMKKALGDFAYKTHVSSTKSMTGHLLGGAGGVEALFTVKALQTGVLPPTINLDNPDPQCDLNYIPHVALEKKINYALSNSFGFGGTNATLCFKKI